MNNGNKKSTATNGKDHMKSKESRSEQKSNHQQDQTKKNAPSSRDEEVQDEFVGQKSGHRKEERDDRKYMSKNKN